MAESSSAISHDYFRMFINMIGYMSHVRTHKRHQHWSWRSYCSRKQSGKCVNSFVLLLIHWLLNWNWWPQYNWSSLALQIKSPTDSANVLNASCKPRNNVFSFWIWFIYIWIHLCILLNIYYWFHGYVLLISHLVTSFETRVYF